MLIIEKNVLGFIKGPSNGLDDAKITAEAKYSINFARSGRKFCFSLCYNGSNNFLFVIATKIHYFDAKEREIKPNHYVLVTF